MTGEMTKGRSRLYQQFQMLVLQYRIMVQQARQAAVMGVGKAGCSSPLPSLVEAQPRAVNPDIADGGRAFLGADRDAGMLQDAAQHLRGIGEKFVVVQDQRAAVLLGGARKPGG